MQESTGAHWNNSAYQQQHAGYASPLASSNQHQQLQQQQQGLAHPVLHKRPSTSQMQGVTYHGAGSPQQPPASPNYPSHAMMSPIPPGSSAGHAQQQQHYSQQGAGSGGMALSPTTRSNPQAIPGSHLAYDQSRMSFSPVLPSGQQQQGQYSNSNNARNLGLGVSSGHPQAAHYNTASAGPSSPFNLADQRQQQQRPTNLVASSGGSYSNANPSSSSSHPQRQFNRTNSSASGALSISTSPTTAGQASPMTPSSPAARGGMQQGNMQHLNQQQHNYHQQQQHSYQSNGGGGGISASNPMHSPLDQQGRPSLQAMQQTPSTSSLSTYTNASSQTPDLSQHAHAQYAAYLEDPMSGLDRRIGAYSPSHYAVGGAPAASGQFAHSPYQQQQQQLPAGASSPRHAQANTYYSPASSNNPIPQGLQQQQHRQSVSLSPSYSRQGQPVASTSMAHAPSTSTTSSTAYSPGLPRPTTTSSASNANMKPYHNRTGSYPSPQLNTNERALVRQRPRSTGSAFRQVRTAADLNPRQGSEQGSRRADPDGGVVSPLKALTTQLSQTYHLVNPNFRYEFSLNPRRVLTKPSKPCGNNGYDNEDSDYILYVNDVLGSEGNKYLILDVLGQGTFGQVVKCQNLKTHEIVGVKVIKNKEAYAQQSTMEIMILDILNGTYDPEDKHHILRLKDSFTHQKHLCLVFELLSSNLYELIKQNSFRGLSLSLVRVFTEQLLDALCVLKEAKLIHCDLKPENILLKTLQSPDIKVIDFGSACHEKQTVYTYIQSRFYRSPEVLLGLPYSTSIDMWSLGCICVELFLGLPLFPGTSEFNQITRIVEMLGLPPTYMLESGKQVHNFFNFYFDNYGQKRWQLKTMEEYQREHPNAKEQPSKKFFNATTLPEIIKQYPNQRKNLSPTDLERESQNRMSFIDFVSGLLNMNPLERWTPQQAKLHPFVQNKEWTGPFVPQQGQMQGYTNNLGASSSRNKEAVQERQYGGLPPAPSRTSTQTYQDAAQYQHHLNAQQAHNALASANAYRQNQYTSNNPYALPSSSLPEQQPSRQQPQNVNYNVPKLPPISVTAPRSSGPSQHSPSHSMNTPSSSRMSTGNPLSPNIPMNPPQAHHYPVRGRSGTFSQLDVPPALQKLGIDLSSIKSIGTPQLRRDEQRAAWERRNTGNSDLDRRRSLKQSNPHLEHLEYYAQTQPGNYYYPSAPTQQPFSVVVDPRMADVSQQRQHRSAASSVTVPPQAYGGQGGVRYVQQQPPQMMQGQLHNGPYDSFDQFDARDGLNALMHQPLLPTQATPNHYYPSVPNQNQVYGLPYGANPDMTAGSVDMGLPTSGGKQKRSDQQMWP